MDASLHRRLPPLALLLLPAPLAVFLELTTTRYTWAILLSLVGLAAACWLIIRDLPVRGALVGVSGLIGLGIAGAALDTLWMVSLNWAAVVLAGVLASRVGNPLPAALAFLLAVALPTAMVRNDISLLTLHLLVVIAAVVSLSIGLILRAERERAQTLVTLSEEQVRKEIAGGDRHGGAHAGRAAGRRHPRAPVDLSLIHI